MAFDRLDPIGGQRLDLLFAQLSEVIWNTSRLRHNDKLESMTAGDFLPEWGPVDEEEQAAKAQERLSRKVAGIFGAMGGGPAPSGS